MNRQYLIFAALAVSILYGVGFAAFDPLPQAYAPLGAGIVAILWVSVGFLGRDEPPRRRDDHPDDRGPQA